MRPLFDNFASMLSVSGPELFQVLFSLGLAVVIAFIISQIYKYTHRGLSFELSFMTTLVLLAPIVTAVMLFIRGDLVLSLGLIGSLSIIRFRTPIKDTRDMVFLFWVIAVGLGSGTYNWVVVILSSMLITTVMFLLHFIRYGQSVQVDYVLVVGGTLEASADALHDVVRSHTKEARIRSKEVEDDLFETIFEVRFQGKEDPKAEALIEALRQVAGVRKVSLLAPQIALPV